MTLKDIQSSFFLWAARKRTRKRIFT